jgi:hypothetical protein
MQVEHTVPREPDMIFSGMSLFGRFPNVDFVPDGILKRDLPVVHFNH